MAGRIYVNQPLVIELDSGIDLAAAGATVAIGARRPDGTTTSFAASIASTTKVRATVAAGVISQSGAWQLQNEVTIAGAMTPGETYVMQVQPRWA